MCEVKTPFSHSEYMNPGILRCQKDIAIYLHCEILPLLSISLFILSNVIVLFRQGNKSQEKEAGREKEGEEGGRRNSGGRWEIGRTVGGRKLFEKEENIRRGSCLARSRKGSVEEINFCHCRRISSFDRSNVHLLNISINLYFLSISRV